MSLRMVVVTTAWGSYCPTFPLPLQGRGIRAELATKRRYPPVPLPCAAGEGSSGQSFKDPLPLYSLGRAWKVNRRPNEKIGHVSLLQWIGRDCSPVACLAWIGRDCCPLACLECIGSGLTGPSHIHIFIYRYTVPLQFRTDSARLAGWPLGWLSGRMVG